MDSRELLATQRRSYSGPSGEGLRIVIGIDLAGVVIAWSPAAARLLGWTADEVLGRPAAELANWGVDAADAAKFLFVGSSGVWIREHVVTARSGRRISLRTTASIVVGPDGADEFLASSVEVPESAVLPHGSGGAQAFRALVERGSDLMLLCSEDRTISYAGPSLSQLFGYLPRELVGAYVSHFVHPEDGAELRRNWEELLSHPDRETTLELRIRNRAGSWRWIELRISNLLADASVAAMVLNIRDVTSQRETATALATTRQLLQSVADAGSDGVWVVDHSGGTVFANARMGQLLGLGAAGLKNAMVSDFFDAATCALLRDGLSDGSPDHRELVEVDVVRRDGERRWLRISAAVYRDAQRRSLGTVALCTDITQRKVLERRLEHLARADASLVSRPTAGLGDDSGVPGLHRLSRRELEVVRRLLDGDRVPAIAEQLFVSQSTIRNHLSSVFRKLRVRSQQELIELMRRHRLRDPAGPPV